MKKSFCTKLAVSATLALAAAAYAQPANDLCANAIVTPAGTGIAFDNTGATTDLASSCGFGGSADVWFRYNALADGTITISTDSGAADDTVLTVYSACGGVELACDDDSGPGFLSLISGFPVTASTSYWIRIAGYGPDGFNVGPGTFNIIEGAACTSTVPNDLCANATVVTPGTGIPFDTTGACQDATITCAFGGSGNSGEDVWFSYTPTANGVISVETTSGPSSDTTLAIFGACGGAQLACDDDSSPNGLLSLISNFPVTAGTNYRIRISGWSPGNQGPGTFNLSFTLPVPPANDNCGAATVASVGNTPIDNNFATNDGSDSCSFGGPNNSGADVWYTFTAPSAGTYRFSTDGGGSLTDTVLSLFDACGGTELACDDDSSPLGLLSRLDFVMTSGQTVLIRVAGWSSLAPNVGTGTLVIVPVVPPANDNCAAASTLTVGTNSYDTQNANTDGASPSCVVGGIDGKDVWYTFTPATNQTLTLETIGNGAAPMFDTTLSIFSGCGGLELACDDDGGAGLLSKICSFNFVAGTTYIIRVGSWGTAPIGGTGDLVVTPSVPVPNDTCAGALPIAAGITSFDTTSACTSELANQDLYYVYTNSTSSRQVLTVDTCGSGFDTILGILDGCSGAVLSANDDFCGFQSQTSACVAAGQSVIIIVGGFGSSFGSGTLNVVAAPSAVANDQCSGAITITPGANPFDNTGACTDIQASCAFGGPANSGSDVWYTFVAGSTGTATIDTFASTVDTQLTAFSACGGPEIACNDDAGGTLQSQICFPVTAGQTYYVALSGFANEQGSGTLNFAIGAGASYSPPANAVAENEACGSDSNGGCNSLPPAYETIAGCVAKSGTGFLSIGQNLRDTDWYEFTLAADDTVTITGQAEFQASVFLIRINDCNGFDIELLGSGATSGGGCGFDFSIPATLLTAGTYHIFVSPTQGGPELACGIGDRYWVQWVGTAGCGPTCNDIDFNNDGIEQDPTDIEAFLSVYSGGPCIPGTAVCDGLDFNNDGIEQDPTDIEAFLSVYSGGPCF